MAQFVEQRPKQIRKHMNTRQDMKPETRRKDLEQHENKKKTIRKDMNRHEKIMNNIRKDMRKEYQVYLKYC